MTLSTVRCRILGQAEIHTKGIRLTPESELQFGLSLYFCANAGRELPRDDLAMLFWPKHSTDAGRHNLRQAIYRLRVLGLPIRNETRTTILDAHLVEADFAQVIGDGSPAAAFLRLTDVSVLPAYAPRLSRGFARWVEDFRTEVGGRLRRGLVRAISEMRARGRYADVERLCRFCLQLDPLNEEATLALAESVALAGGKAEAVGLIDRYAGEIGAYRPELRVPASLLRERISDRIVRRHQARIELPMIGREADAERLMSAFQKLRGNQAVSYVVLGQAGVGKTRLAYECCHIAELQGARLVTIATQPSSRTQAFFGLSELVDNLLQMPGAIGCAPAALDCLRAMSSAVPHWNSSSAVESDGESRFAMVRWSILDVLDAILVEGPLVIHVDDAHQLDPQSQAILQDCLKTHSRRPLLVLFTMRQPERADTERFARLFDTSTVHELMPLSDANCDRVVAHFCAAKDEALDPRIRERMIQLSGGNPFFLVELLAHRSELDTDELPATVQALLDDRLSRLSTNGIAVLRAVAVLGLSSTVERVRQVLEHRTNDVLEAVGELHAAGLLSLVGSGLHCRHDTIRDTIIARTPRAAALLLHGRTARVLTREALREGSVALLWECLRHFRAAQAHRSGDRVALILSKRLLNLGLARDAFDVLTDVTRAGSDRRLRLVALSRQAYAAKMLRQWDEVSAAIAQWRQLHESSNHLNHRHSAMELLECEVMYNAPNTLCALPRRIHDCVRAPDASTRHKLSAGALLMLSAHNNGDERLARETYDAIVQHQPRSPAERIDRLTTEAVFHCNFGDVNRAPPLLRNLVDEALTLPQPPSRAMHLRRASFGIARYDDPVFGRELLTTSLQTFERLQLPTQAMLCVEDLGVLAISNGDFDDARHWMQRATDLRMSCADVLSESVEYELRTMFAFEAMSNNELPRFTLTESASTAFLRPMRARQMHFALRGATMLVSGDLSEIGSVLKELASLHEVLRARGCQDLAVAVLATGLHRTGKSDDAQDLVLSYLKQERRERSFIPASLRRIAAELSL